MDFSDLRLATEEEIKEVLVAEAKRRGFVEGVTIKGSGINAQFSPGILEPINGEFYFAYDKEGIREILDTKDGKGFVYENGKWAEILKDPSIILQSKIGTSYEVLIRKGRVKVGCREYTEREMAQFHDLMRTYGITMMVFGFSDNGTVADSIEVSYEMMKNIYGRMKKML